MLPAMKIARGEQVQYAVKRGCVMSCLMSGAIYNTPF